MFFFTLFTNIVIGRDSNKVFEAIAAVEQELVVFVYGREVVSFEVCW